MGPKHKTHKRAGEGQKMSFGEIKLITKVHKIQRKKSQQHKACKGKKKEKWREPGTKSKTKYKSKVQTSKVRLWETQQTN